MRTIHKIVSAERVNMGGILLDQALPVQELEMVDPFILIHHWNQHYDGGQPQKELGVGPHPHRGFAPVTYIFEGGLQHRDSRGNNSVVRAGGTQWINSGMGLIHSERPAADIAENGGDLELIQFWINLPAKYKMDQPRYIPLTETETPELITDDGKTKVKIVAGDFKGLNGGIDALSPLLLLRLEFEAGGRAVIPVPENFNAILYILDGNIRTGGKETSGKDLVWYNNDHTEIELEAMESSRAILLAGEPLEEPVVASGPFVMNTDTEIMEAMRDYRMGKMGFLAEEF
ncbi:MAG TPA: pirin-like C-terminal cupin domain-containing protein [Bacteroidales bacterium]|nr:pirin-like C-terminal cupin domain-containing protein [Bacteroidales bacterium]